MKIQTVSIVLVIATIFSLSIVRLAGQQADKPSADKGRVDFLEDVVEVEGLGLPPDNSDPNTSTAYALARRAATVDADRNLGAILQGIYVDATTRVGNLAVEADRINEELRRTKVPGGQVIQETSQAQYMNMGARDKLVRVRVRYPLQGGALPFVMNVVKDKIREKEVPLPVFQPPAALPPAAVPSASGPAPPSATISPPSSAPAYDGLIVRVPADFRPSLDPKIFTPKGEVVYGARMVAMDVLISLGVARFTDTEAKAKVALEKLGCKNILTVTGSMRTVSDTEISFEDAAKIARANQQNNLLEKARVVFLVSRRG